MNLKITCANGHEDLFRVSRSPAAPPVDPETAAIVIDLLEWQANDAPNARGCATCGAKITVERLEDELERRER